MKKLDKKIINVIQDGIEIGAALGIESIVMDNISLRGENSETSTNIIFNTDGLDFPFDAIGIGRVSLFKTRLAMFTDPTVEVTVEERNDQLMASNVHIKHGRTSAGFRCQDPSRIKAPKRIKDEVVYELHLNDDDITRINKGIGTMSSEIVNFYIEDDKMIVGVSDKEGDIFTHEIEGGYSVVSDNATRSFSKTYKSKTFKTIVMNYMKKDNNEILPISITSRGIMKVEVLGIDIYLFPER